MSPPGCPNKGSAGVRWVSYTVNGTPGLLSSSNSLTNRPCLAGESDSRPKMLTVEIAWMHFGAIVVFIIPFS